MIARFALLLFAVVILSATRPVTAETPAEALFNGKDLTGWKIVPASDAAKTVFTVSDGAIHAYPTHTDGSKQPFVALVTEKEYQDYRLCFEFRWGKKKFAPREGAVRDAGVLFHVFDDTKLWPRSVECQIQEGDTGDIWALGARVSSRVHPPHRNYRPNGQPITIGGHDKPWSRFGRSHSWERPGWNEIDLTIRGDAAVYRVNSHVVNEVFDMQRWDAESASYVPLTSGAICLQAEGAEVFYRNITVQPLPVK